ncbi:MAG: hypothetical protein WC679_13420 [Bacteroidales bacterium]
MSTFSVLYMLDEAIFNANTSCGIVSYSLEHAQHIFKRIIGHALDNLKPLAKSLVGIVQRNATEITFANGSFLKVGTTLRGGTCQKVLVSEFGKTCARNPLKAEEVVTGTLQTVAIDGQIIIESTGEGNEGYFVDMINSAHQRQNQDISPLEYKLFFFAWFEEPTYIMTQPVSYDIKLSDYFDKLEKDLDIKITQPQRYWYAHMQSILGDKMKQEFPSTVSEAFLSSSDAYYFQSSIEKAYQDYRCLNTSTYDPIHQTYVAMDIGLNDLTVITFFQLIHGEIRIIDFYADNNKSSSFYANFLLKDKPYIYNTIFLPHDSRKRDGVIIENNWERDFKTLFAHTEAKVHVLTKTDKSINISNAKIKFDRCVFNLNKVKPLIDMLRKYRKKWSEQYGKYLDEPYEGIEEHYADSFIYTMQAVSHIEAVGDIKGAYLKHKEAVEMRKYRV